MAKKGMKRPERTHTQPRNQTDPVPELQGKAKHTKNVQCQNALKTAVQAAKTALADPTERATLEAGFAAQSKYASLFGYTVAQKYVRPNFA